MKTNYFTKTTRHNHSPYPVELSITSTGEELKNKADCESCEGSWLRRDEEKIEDYAHVKLNLNIDSGYYDKKAIQKTVKNLCDIIMDEFEIYP